MCGFSDTYTDKENVTIDAAFAPIGIAGVQAKLLFVNEAGKGGKLVLVPNPNFD